MISSTHCQTANWPASPLCASSNQVDSPICVTPPKRTEYLFEPREGWNSQAWPYKVMNSGTTPGHISIEKIQISLLFPVMQWQVPSYTCTVREKYEESYHLSSHTLLSSQDMRMLCCASELIAFVNKTLADSHNCYTHTTVNWQN